MKKITVLMSTFNGERFLKPQIESILEQDLHPHLLIIDDGSKDGTVELLSEWSDLQPRIQFKQAQNIGFPQCFFRLIEEVELDSEYYAFTDQDDVWMPNKLSKAIEKMQDFDPDQPLMYCSALELVDENLKPLGKSVFPKVKPCLEHSLLHNMATGCTVVINQSAIKLIKKAIPKNVFSHDWWIYIVISTLGQVILDDCAYILYRQHNNNAIGMSNKSLSRWINRVRALMKDSRYTHVRLQALEFYTLYEKDLDQTSKEILTEFISCQSSGIKKFHFILYGKVKHPLLVQNYLYKILTLTNIIK